jgi:hypothetical protein
MERHLSLIATKSVIKRSVLFDPSKLETVAKAIQFYLFKI